MSSVAAVPHFACCHLLLSFKPPCACVVMIIDCSLSVFAWCTHILATREGSLLSSEVVPGKFGENAVTSCIMGPMAAAPLPLLVVRPPGGPMATVPTEAVRPKQSKETQCSFKKTFEKLPLTGLSSWRRPCRQLRFSLSDKEARSGEGRGWLGAASGALV